MNLAARILLTGTFAGCVLGFGAGPFANWVDSLPDRSQENAPTLSAKCAYFWCMTQDERKARYEAREKPAFDIRDRARWACSREIERRAAVPDSLRWTMRRDWRTTEVRPGLWRVHAVFVATNRLGVEYPDTVVCTMRQTTDDSFQLVRN